MTNIYILENKIKAWLTNSIVYEINLIKDIFESPFIGEFDI